jgi:hypothetical protein
MPTRQATPLIRHSTRETAKKPSSPQASASGGTSTAAIAVPRGSAIWRTPIAIPRMLRGNQPATIRPVAVLTLEPAAPTAARTRTRASGECTRSAHTRRSPIAAAMPLRKRPRTSASRSPRRSDIAPHATSVSTMPMLVAVPTMPPWARVKPSWARRCGMRKAGPVIAKV